MFLKNFVLLQAPKAPKPLIEEIDPTTYYFNKIASSFDIDDNKAVLRTHDDSGPYLFLSSTQLQTLLSLVRTTHAFLCKSPKKSK